METFFNIFRKIVIGMVFIVFGATMVYVPQHYGNISTVPTAQAGATVSFDPWNLIQNTASAIADTAMNIFSSALNVKEFTLDGIAWAVAKMIVSNMVSSLLDWINSGFEGSPAFVQNLGQFLLQTADEEFGRAIQEVAPFICSPFKLDVQIAIALKYDQARQKRPPTCTLSGVFANFEAFMEGEFSEGGWNDWFKITSQPNVYTQYGSMLSIDSTINARVINAKGEQFSILDFGGGFLSGKICETVTDGNGVQSEQCVISKPGQTIADSLSKSLGAGQDTLVTADEISEIVAALLTQLANKAFSGAAGLLGLSGGTGYTYQNYSRGSFAEELRSGAAATQTGGVDTGTTANGEGTPAQPGDTQFANDFLANQIQAHLAAKTRVEGYLTRLQAFNLNTLNSTENRITASVYITEANSLLDSLNRESAEAAPIAQEYLDLATEYETATPERRVTIRELQADAIQRFNAVGLTPARTLSSIFARWDQLLAQDVSPACVPNWSAGFYDENCDGIEDQFIIDPIGEGGGCDGNGGLVCL